jgi:hypothetical protein
MSMEDRDNSSPLVETATDLIAARRSVSWSAPPVKSWGNVSNSASVRSSSMSNRTNSSITRTQQHQQEQEQLSFYKTGKYFTLPPLSEYALKTGVIFEGWLLKKSAITGFWQKVQYTCMCNYWMTSSLFLVCCLVVID